MVGHIPLGTVESWLGASRSIWLATTRPDGRAHAAPVWFVWDGRRIYFATPATTQKQRNLAHAPWAVAHLGDGDDTLILEGAVARVTDPAEIAEVDVSFRRKYVDPHSGATAGYPETDLHVPYRIDVERIMVWEYGVVATRTDFLPRSDGRWDQSLPRGI